MSQFYLKSTNFLPTLWMHALCFGKSGRKWICNVKKLQPLFQVQPLYCEKTNKNWQGFYFNDALEQLKTNFHTNSKRFLVLWLSMLEFLSFCMTAKRGWMAWNWTQKTSNKKRWPRFQPSFGSKKCMTMTYIVALLKYN